MKNNLRYVAYEIVYEVLFKNGYSNLLLQNRINEFNEQDKSLITNIVYGTIQNFDLLKYQLNKVEYNKINNKQLSIIVIALYQKYFLDKIPDYAIVNEAIECSKLISKNSSAFISAILNKLVKTKIIYADTKDEDYNLAINYSHPLWLIKMIKKQYNKQILVKYLKSNHNISRIHLRYNIMSNEREKLLIDNLIEKTNNEISFFYNGNDVTNFWAYKEGIVSVQDFSSQEVGLFSGVKPNMKVLDMCCAPGTKTTHLAELMNDTGIIKAYDIHSHKIPLVNNQLKRLRLTSVKANVCDSTKLDNVEENASFDLILCDALCTGLGVIKRKPEIKYQDIGKTMDYIVEVQKKLLEQAYKLLKPGGTLIYSTCTINKKENEKQVEALLNNHLDLSLEKQKTIFNFENDADCFYMAKIIKN